MGFTAEIDNKAEEAAKESEGNGTFPPLPAGKYQVTIVKVKGVTDFKAEFLKLKHNSSKLYQTRLTNPPVKETK